MDFLHLFGLDHEASANELSPPQTCLKQRREPNPQQMNRAIWQISQWPSFDGSWGNRIG